MKISVKGGCFGVFGVTIMLLGVSGVASAAQTVNPFSYDFTLDSSLTTISIELTVRSGTKVKDSDSTAVSGTGQISADIFQTGLGFQDLSAIQINDFELVASNNPSVSLSWFSGLILCSANATLNNLIITDAGQSGIGAIDSSGDFAIEDCPLYFSGTIDYDYRVALLITGDGNEDLSELNDGEPNLVDLAGNASLSSDMITLSINQVISGSEDLSEYVDGYSIDYTITSNIVTLPQAIQTPISGDANCDGMIDVGDLGILAANYGQTDLGWAEGDFNFDGVVDVGDLGILASNYGSGVTAVQSNSIPEPMTLGFMMIAGICGIIRRQK